MGSSFLIYGMICAGVAVMLVSIILYIRYMKAMAEVLKDEKEGKLLLFVPLILLVLFFIGYLVIMIWGRPDLLVAGILFGGSIFVFLVIRVMKLVSYKIREHEKLQAALKAAETANASKTVFLSSMSHDIRTPLNAILGYTVLSRRGGLTIDEAENYFSKIEQSGKHLLGLIDEVLEMSRIESGKMELEITRTDIRSLLRETYDLFALQMKEKNISYTVDGSGIEYPIVKCDRLRVSRVLLNLVSNALKFTPPGGSVTVTAAENEDLYEFRVKDTGIGMSEEFAARIFEAFEREQTATVSGIQGTGLGMTITKSIVDLMGGTIDVITSQGKGTEFIVKVRFERCLKTSDEECFPEESAPADFDFSGRRLLLAEDVEVNREIAAIMLKDLGFEVEMAENGKEAVEMVSVSQPGHFDAVLMDIQMPVMDGYEAARAIRSLPDPELCLLPIVALTANAFSEDKKMAEQAGMDGHIAKPIDPENLKKTLGALLPA